MARIADVQDSPAAQNQALNEPPQFGDDVLTKPVASNAAVNAALVSKILSAARGATFIRLLAQVISWASTLVVVRYVSSTDYGLNSMLEAPLELLLLFSTLGLDLALIRAKTLGPDQTRPAFGALILLNLLLFVVYFFGSAAIASYFNEPRLRSLMQAVAFVFLLVPFRVIPNAILDRELKFKLRAGVELASSSVAALMTLVLAVLGFGVWALVIGVLTNRTVAAVLLMVIQPWIASPSFKLGSLRGSLAVGGTLTLSSAFAVTAGMFPVLIGGPALGPTLLGFYAIAIQFAMLPLSKVMPIVNSIAYPLFSKFEGQPVAVGGYVAASLGAGAMVLLPIQAGLASTSVAFSLGVLGPQWADAALPLAILALVMPIRGVALFMWQVLNGIGRADLTLRCTAVVWVAGLGSVYFGSRYGLGGLVAAYALTEIIGCSVTWLLARRAISLPARTVLKPLVAPVVSTVVMVGAVLACSLLLKNLEPLVVLFGQIAAGMVSYAVMLRFVFRAEAQRLISLVKG